MLQQPLTPIIIEVASQPATEEITVLDVLMGVFGFIGAIAGVAVVLGVLFAGGLIMLRHRRAASPDAGTDETVTTLGLSN
ncbi:MAG: hypothetical protein O3A25_08530 [Acidobacteria bacterium]|nr:hypothetical protein [Acidobacteriota bacterium]